MPYVLFYLLLVNLAGAVLVAVDKWKARRHRWRVPRKDTVFAVFSGRLPGRLPDDAPLPPQNPAQTVYVGHSCDFSLAVRLLAAVYYFREGL